MKTLDLTVIITSFHSRDKIFSCIESIVKSIKWLDHFYGFYLEEKIKTAVIWHKSTSKFIPDYSVDYLKDSPWIHMPFEKYETTNIKDFKFEE